MNKLLKELAKELVVAIESNIEVLKGGNKKDYWVDAVRLQYINEELEDLKKELKK